MSAGKDPFLNDIPSLVRYMSQVVSSMTPEELVAHGRADVAVIIKLGLDEITQKVANLIGVSNLDVFYEGCPPKGVSGTFHLGLPIANMIMASTQYDGLTNRISLDSELLSQRLTGIANAVAAGQVQYSISLRLVNVDIDSDFDLSKDIQFRKLSTEEIVEKYPLNPQFNSLHPRAAPHNEKHCVEAVVRGVGKLAVAKQRNGIEETDKLKNSILHAFLFSDLEDKCVPNVTHVLFRSDAESALLDCGVSSFSFEPYRLTPTDISDVKCSFQLLQDAESDRILGTVIDRFLLGMKRGTHHPNRINEPNWDKIVDYAIAMETLFLTVNSGEVVGELVYRFRMNGSSVIAAATGESREIVFDALNCLYTLRSKVVHGSDDGNILKPANKFIVLLGIDCENHRHSLGRLLLIDKQVRHWLKQSILYVSKMQLEDRPYRKHHGWERLIWNNVR